MAQKQGKLRGGDEVELQVEAVAAGGRGVARSDGYVVFVRGGVPGDRVKVRMGRCRRDYGEGRVLEVLEPSPSRVAAPCDRFGVCGGCALQHQEYGAQLEAKRQIVVDALTRVGGLGDVRVAPCVPSPDPYRYRNKMEFSFARRRWLEREDLEAGESDHKGAALGLHVPRVFDKVIEMDACHLQDARCDEILRFARDHADRSPHTAYDVRARQGFWRFLVLRVGVHTGEVMVLLVTSRNEEEAAAAFAREALERFPFVTTLVHGIAPRPASAVILEEERVLHGPGHIVERIGGLEFEISPTSFFQPNPRAAELLFDHVIESAGELEGKTVFDVYSGTGALSLLLARRAGRVEGLEIAVSAVQNARRNAERNGIGNARFRVGDVRATLAETVEKRGRPEVLVLDPPRAGNHPKVLSALVELAAPRVVYVSCNPATCARDLSAFVDGGYEIGGVTPVDQFPQTAHVEVVVTLGR